VQQASRKFPAPGSHCSSPCLIPLPQTVPEGICTLELELEIAATALLVEAAVWEGVLDCDFETDLDAADEAATAGFDCVPEADMTAALDRLADEDTTAAFDRLADEDTTAAFDLLLVWEPTTAFDLLLVWVPTAPEVEATTTVLFDLEGEPTPTPELEAAAATPDVEAAIETEPVEEATIDGAGPTGVRIKEWLPAATLTNK